MYSEVGVVDVGDSGVREEKQKTETCRRSHLKRSGSGEH
jgi:hypothetical protein